jgi:hypothetical protein
MRNSRKLLAPVHCAMKNSTLNRSTFKLTVVALLTLLFAGCAAESPSAGSLSFGAQMRTGGPATQKSDDLQSNPKDSPQFIHWGSSKDL